MSDIYDNENMGLSNDLSEDGKKAEQTASNAHDLYRKSQDLDKYFGNKEGNVASETGKQAAKKGGEESIKKGAEEAAKKGTQVAASGVSTAGGAAEGAAAGAATSAGTAAAAGTATASATAAGATAGSAAGPVGTVAGAAIGAFLPLILKILGIIAAIFFIVTIMLTTFLQATVSSLIHSLWPYNSIRELWGEYEPYSDILDAEADLYKARDKEIKELAKANNVDKIDPYEYTNPDYVNVWDIASVYSLQAQLQFYQKDHKTTDALDITDLKNNPENMGIMTAVFNDMMNYTVRYWIEPIYVLGVHVGDRKHMVVKFANLTYVEHVYKHVDYYSDSEIAQLDMVFSFKYNGISSYERYPTQKYLDNIFNRDFSMPFTKFSKIPPVKVVSLLDGSGTFTRGTKSIHTLNATERAEVENNWDSSLSDERKKFVRIAMDAVGMIPYYWGGKPKYQGFPITSTIGGTVGSITSPDGYGRTQAGFDCSGFVSWVYWTAFDKKPSVMGTGGLCTSIGGTKITANQLKVGDLGLQNEQGTSVNHIGIFVGYDEHGNTLWCHCNGGDNTVVVGTNSCFRIFYRLPID